MARNVSRRSRACTLAAALLAVVALLAAGCGSSELEDRYEAERMAWRAGKLAQAMRSNPELMTDEMLARVRSSYEAIVARYPRTGEPTTELGRDIASIAGRSRLVLAGMAFDRGDADAALGVLASVRESCAFDRALCVEARLTAGSMLEATGRWEDAAEEYEALTEEWPPAAEASGAPDARILRTPIKLAAGYAVRGEAARAAEFFERARDYYDRWIGEWEGSPTARLALELKGESYAQEGRFADAAGTLEHFDGLYGNEQNRAAIWLRLAEIYSAGLRNTARAREYYEKTEAAYPSKVSGATAAIALAALDIDAARYPEARARLERVLAEFRGEPTVSATAMHYLALSYELGGSWETAVARYNALSQEHPATLYGLQAPLHVARHYRDAGQAAAAASAYERAVQHYRRVSGEWPSTPADLTARSYLVEARLDQGKWEEAAETLVETAGGLPGSEAAPGMLLQAAALYASKLGDEARARELLARVRAGHAGTAAGEEAKARLDALDRRGR